MKIVCDRCKGEGTLDGKKCPKCHGKKKVYK